MKNLAKNRPLNFVAILTVTLLLLLSKVLSSPESSPILRNLQRRSPFDDGGDDENVNPISYCNTPGVKGSAPLMTEQQLEDNSLIKSRSFIEGRDVLFPVRFTFGCPLPNVAQWLKDGALIDPSTDSRFKIDIPSFRLKISRARPNDSGEYLFHVNNSEGSLDYTFRIIVTGAPDWCSFDAPVANRDCDCLPIDYTVGKTFSINCNVCANETALVEWYRGRDGEDLQPVISPTHLDTRIEITETANSSTLRVQFLLPLDDGMQFECRAKNRFGSFAFKWQLRHKSAAQPIIQPPLIHSVVNATASVGEEAKVICNIGFTGEEMFSDTIWLRGDYVKLMVAKNFTRSNSTAANHAVYLVPKFASTYPEYRENGSSNIQELIFKPVKETDYGPHTCFYTNTAGASARVVWLKKPTIEPDVVMPIAIGVTVGGLIFIAIVVILVVCLYRQRRIGFKPIKKRIVIMAQNEIYNVDHIQHHEVQIVVAGNGSSGVTSSVARSKYKMELDPRWEIARKLLIFGEPIGDGNIGLVVAAKLHHHFGETTQDVAVKMLRDDATDEDLLQLVKELMLLKQVGSHPNVINFIGCCTQNGPLLVVVELARYGNLRDFLRRNRPQEPEADYCSPSSPTAVSLSNWSTDNGHPLIGDGAITLTHQHLINFAHQIAKGMEYLSSRGCIHRDLAARNVLVADNFQLKVSDFGLTRQVGNISTDYYRRGQEAARLPLKWLAPESLLESKYTSKSDVWSYGILLWEIYSLGDSPYRDLPSYVDNMIEYIVTQKRRLDQPKFANRFLYDHLFKPCWHEVPELRPSFEGIRKWLEEYGQNVSHEPLAMIMSPTSPSTPSVSFPGGQTAKFSVNRQFPIAPSPKNQRQLLPSITEPTSEEARDSIDSQEQQPPEQQQQQHVEQNGDAILIDNNDNCDNESGESGCIDDVMSKPPSSPGVITSSDSQYSSTSVGTTVSTQDVVFTMMDERTHQHGKTRSLSPSNHPRLAMPHSRQTFPSTASRSKRPSSTSSESSMSQRRSSYGEDSSSRLFSETSLGSVSPSSPTTAIRPGALFISPRSENVA